MVYQRGDSAYFKLQHKTYTFLTDVWALADPDATYPKITITDSAGTAKVAAATMTKVTTGKYDYSYQIATDAETGTWTGYIETSNSTYKDRQYLAFDVE